MAESKWHKNQSRGPRKKCDGVNVGQDLPIDSPVGTCLWSLEVFPSESSCGGEHEELAGFAAQRKILCKKQGLTQKAAPLRRFKAQCVSGEKRVKAGLERAHSKLLLVFKGLIHTTGTRTNAVRSIQEQRDESRGLL